MLVGKKRGSSGFRSPTAADVVFADRRAPRRGSASSSERTRARILAACYNILASNGHAQFTMRRVAAAANITQGNLAYHYPSKRQLLREFISSLVTECEADIEQAFRDASVGEQRGLSALIPALINKSVDRRISRLFRELWALSLHDRVIAQALTTLYERAWKQVAELLSRTHPEVDSNKAEEIVYLIAMIVEGANPIYALDPSRGAPLLHVKALAVRAVMSLLEESEPKKLATSRPSAPRRPTR
jgi:AcrR family transcriptional regulator